MQYSEEPVYRSVSIDAGQSLHDEISFDFVSHATKINDIHVSHTSHLNHNDKPYPFPYQLKRCYTTDKLICDDFLRRVPDAIYEANVYRKMIHVPLYIRN